MVLSSKFQGPSIKSQTNNNGSSLKLPNGAPLTVEPLKESILVFVVKLELV